MCLSFPLPYMAAASLHGSCLSPYMAAASLPSSIYGIWRLPGALSLFFCIIMVCAGVVYPPTTHPPNTIIGRGKGLDWEMCARNLW